jgi:DNA-directed RNA polymerase subunit RPC12/RpoP
MENLRAENFKLGEGPWYENSFEYTCPTCGKSTKESRPGPHPLSEAGIKCECGYSAQALMPWLEP